MERQMRRTSAGVWLAAALASGLAAGCQTGPVHHLYMDDPLLLSKKPVDGKAEHAGSILTAAAEPTPPMERDTLLAAGSKNSVGGVEASENPVKLSPPTRTPLVSVANPKAT